MKAWHLKHLPAIVLLAMCCCVARADEGSKQAKIQELFTTMHLSTTFDAMMDQSSTQGAQAALSMFPNVKFTPAQKKVLDTKLAEIRSVLHETLSWTKLQPEIARVYAENYSEATIDGLLAFYKSPTGQEMLAKQATIMAQSSAVVQHASIAMQPRMQEIMRAMAEDMKNAEPSAK